MTQYTKSTNFATKDNLTPGDPLKVVRGTEIDTEFNNIATAVATKTDNASAAITGGAIDGATVGATTPATGSFTTLAASGTTTLAGALVGAVTQAAFNTVSTTLNLGGAATAVNLGAATGTATVNNTTLAAKAITASTTLAVTGTSTLTGAVTATAGVTGPITSSSVSITGGSITGITDLAVADGGTGASTAAGGLNNLLPSQTSNANKYLQTDGTNASWDAVSLSTADITGTLGVANGGTGVTTSTGTTNVVLSNSPTLVTPNLGVPSFATLTSATGLPISTGVSGLGTNVATFLATPSSANLAAALTDETGSGANVFATSPTLVTPNLGTPTNLVLTSATGLPLTTGVTGTLPTANGGTNLTSFTSGGVVYASSSSVLATSSLFTWDATNLVIQNASGAGFYINGNSTSIPNINFYNTTSNQVRGFVKYDFAAEGMLFAASGSEQMRLTSTGLGIGTSSPSYKLDVADQARIAVSNGSAQLRLERTGGSAGASWLGADSDNLLVVFNTSFSSKLTLTSAGNLGLGVTPSAWSANRPTLEFGGSVQPSIAFNGNATNGGAIWTNSYYDGNNSLYKANGYASRFETSSGAFRFYQAASGTAGNTITFTQAMTLDASGNLVIGGTTAKKRLTVTETLSSSTTPGTNPVVWIGGGNANISTLSEIGFTYGGFGSETYAPATIGYQLTSSSGFTKGALTFCTRDVITDTAPTERARITSAGYSKFSNTGTYLDATGTFHELRADNANSYALIVSNSNSTPLSEYIQDWRFTGSTPNNTNARFWNCEDATANRAYMLSNGGLANYAANNVILSDRREKTNFAPATSYLEKICAIPVQTFNYIDQNLEEDGGLTLGVVAQDVQAVAPELVSEGNWGTKENPKMRLEIYQTDLQYALMKALQELKADFDAYKASHP